MESYLSGYLSVLPQSERVKIVDVLKENSDLLKVQNISEKNFNYLIELLVEKHEAMTQFLPQTEELNAEKFNQFFSNVLIDLTMLYKEIYMIEAAEANFDHIFDSVLEELKEDVKKIKNEIKKIELAIQEENGLLIEEDDFSDRKKIEEDTSKTSLFLDRDGKELPLSEREYSYGVSYMSLPKTKKIDATKNNTGKTTAKIKKEDGRGTPTRGEDQTSYQITYALDGSYDTYWGEVVLVDEEIKTQMKK